MSDRRSRGSFLLALAIAALIGWFAERENRKPFVSADELRRGAATRQRVERILDGVGPHPVGTEPHRAVRDRIMSELRALGLEPMIERDFTCSSRGSCAVVENIVARRKGQTNLPPLLVATHYDSVPAGPGAGDAMLAVASTLQTIEELRNVALSRDVVFLIGDGEERGLLGASAYTNRHPAGEHFAVLNFEARGTSGPLLMFETTQPDGPLAEIYARSARSPATGSLFSSIYERLPNDTDLTVFRDRGFRGLNFAIIGTVEHYHTPLDAPRSLEPHAVARYSSEMKRAVKHFANHPRALERGRSATFFDLFHRVALAWPSWFDWILTTLVLSAVVVLMRERRPRPSLRATLHGFAITTGAIVVPVAIMVAISRFLRRDSDWMVDGRLALVATSLIVIACIALAARTASPIIDGETVLAASSALILTFLFIVFLLVLPGGAYIVLLPALSGVIHLAGVRSGLGWATMPVALIANAAIIAMLVPAIEDALGLPGMPVNAFLIAIMLLPLMTVRDRKSLDVVAIVSIIAAIFSVVAAARSSRFDDIHPAGRSILAVSDDSGARYFHRISSNRGVSGLRTPSAWSITESPFAWANDDYLRISVTPGRVNLPDVIVDRTAPNRYTITIVSRRRAQRAAVTFSDADRIRSIEIGGRSIDPQIAKFGQFVRVMHHTHGAGPEPVSVVVEDGEPLKIWIEDQAFESFDELRTPHGVEYQEGDLSIALRPTMLR